LHPGPAKALDAAMKKTLALVLITCALLTPGALSAKDFEGTVRMKITDGRSKAMPLEYSIKGGLLRTDIQAEEGMTMTAIMDFAKDEMIMLMPGQPMYMVMPIKSTAAQASGHTGEEPELVNTGETETILGYPCTKYLAKSKEAVTEIWATEEIGAFMGLGSAMSSPMGGKAAPQSWEKSLVGKNFFPLRVVSGAGSRQKFRMDVTAIEPKSLPASFFAPPAGYQKFDMGGMMKGLGGNPFGR
jgi:hypothetical protein